MGPFKIWTGGNKDLNKLVLDKIKELDLDKYNDGYGYCIDANNYVSFWSCPIQSAKNFEKKPVDEISIPDFLALKKPTSKIRVGCTWIEDLGDKIKIDETTFSKQDESLRHLVEIWETGWFFSELIDWSIQVREGVLKVDGEEISKDDVLKIIKILRKK